MHSLMALYLNVQNRSFAGLAKINTMVSYLLSSQKGKEQRGNSPPTQNAGTPVQTGEQIWLVLHIICPTKVRHADFCSGRLLVWNLGC